MLRIGRFSALTKCLNKTRRPLPNTQPFQTQTCTKRYFSTPDEARNGSQNNSSNDSTQINSRINFWWSVFGLWKNIAMRYSIITFAIVSIVWLAWTVMSFFGSLTFDEVGKWSFYAGFLTCLSLVIVLNLYRRQYTYKTHQVFREAFNRTTGNPQIRELMGTPIISGKFKAFGYELRDGTMQDFDQSYHQWIWNYMKRLGGFGKQKNLQMLFQINGTKRMAIVSCEVTKLPGLTTMNNLAFQSLSVDVFHKDQVAKPGTKVRIILEGTDQDVVRDKAFTKF